MNITPHVAQNDSLTKTERNRWVEAGVCPKTPNRTKSPSESPTKQREQLQSSMFFSKLLILSKLQ
jgi:hypothetical protein